MIQKLFDIFWTSNLSRESENIKVKEGDKYENSSLWKGVLTFSITIVIIRFFYSIYTVKSFRMENHKSGNNTQKVWYM